jgi:hypothetical protein
MQAERSLEQLVKTSIEVESAILLHWRMDGSGYVVGQVGLVDGVLNFVLDDSTHALHIAHAYNPKWRIDSDGDTCKIGASCGDTCIARSKKCRISLNQMAPAQLKSLKSALIAAGKPGAGESKPASASAPKGGASSGGANSFMRDLTVPDAKTAGKAAGVAAGAVVGLAIAGLATELTLTRMPKEQQALFRKTPDGLADEQTLAAYDQLKPGTMIRRQTYMVGAGARLHYGVYAGKDEETGEHMIIDTGTKMIDGKLITLITLKPMIIDGKLGGSEYQPVPREEMHLKGGPKISRAQALKRAKALVGVPYTYKGFSENCETFARSVVEGRSYSTQAEQVSAFTSKAADLVFEAFVLKHGNSPYSEKNGRMGTKKMLELLEQKGLGKKRKPLPDPEEYAKQTEAIAKKMPELADRIRVKSYEQYFHDFYESQSPVAA